MKKGFTSAIVISAPASAFAAGNSPIDQILAVGGIAGVILLVLSVVLCVLWIVLPFIIISMNNKLHRIEQHLNASNHNLRSIAENTADLKNIETSTPNKPRSQFAPTSPSTRDSDSPINLE